MGIKERKEIYIIIFSLYLFKLHSLILAFEAIFQDTLYVIYMSTCNNTPTYYNGMFLQLLKIV